MKKILIVLMASLALFSCRKTDSPYEEKVSTISIAKQDLYFLPDGGDGFVELNAEDAITAESDRPWCHVSVEGKRVNVKVDPFDDMESRYSKIIVRCGADSVYTTAQQQGVIIGGIEVKDAYFGSLADSLIVPYKANVSAKATADVAWITTKVNSDTLRIYAAANTTGHYRDGKVTCTLGAKNYDIKIAQVNIDEIKTVQYWTLSGKTPDGTNVTFDVNLSAGVMNITGSGADWKITPTFSNASVDIPLTKTSIGNYSHSGTNLLVFATAGNDAPNATSLQVQMSDKFAFGVNKDSQTGKWVLIPAAKELAKRFDPLCLRFDMWTSSKSSTMQNNSTYSIVLKNPEFKQK